MEFKIDEVTVGQAEFICEYTGRSLAEFADILESTNLTGRDIVAVLAVIENPEDPEAALPAVRKIKVSDIDVSANQN